MITRLRRIALTAALAGGLVLGGLAATSPASAATDARNTASVSPMMYVEYGPFSSSDACYIHRGLNDWRYKSDCTFQWDSRHPIGFYYGEYNR
ncbi:hypothetical protein GCM10022225_36180 [Plantactinospora mayteni]|uniref:Secreted protein n=1 Tax=Plantactinospora mayteni TaxID=566021 RepID=A0ABQ4EM26_9ACTN|nr:hypothetical protein [Plantactinospora mayteni]GIG95771.1 hypothetical protein Pma05_23440 [Plantactinospora mayteni]